ncbi:MAG TPA: preprotein translocase subunit YajC [Acidimicrobiales bacterium]|nr:preprotein translocase subunit YajC [Acidimicrobiales bacterium]
MLQLLFPFIFLALMWVLLVRPQQQRVRQQRDLVASLKIGDEVVTAGGIIGRIVDLTEEEAIVEIAPAVNMRFLRGAINARLNEHLDEAPGSAAGELTDPSAGEEDD